MSTIERLHAALAERYRVERELGAGGMATVYLAQDLKHDRRVAIKVLKPELSAVIGAERFLAEIKVTANLQHPHILALFDSGQVDGTVFYAMPFIEGESLRDRLSREKQLPIDDALRIAREVGDALQYAHTQGVIHRDIKPENILLHGGHALVADFGIALAASSTGGSRMTETGMSLGTPTYMSPEQAMGERIIDARTDIYALGCVLYEMLTGDPPFTASTAQGVVARVLTEKPAPVTARRDRVSPGVEAAILTALEKLPADRHPTAAHFLAALSAEPRAVVSRGRGGSWVERNARILLAVAALLVVGSAAYAVSQRGTSAPAAVNRFIVSLDAQARLDGASNGSRVAWAPDGRAFVYAGTGGSGGQLWMRPLDAMAATPVAGTDGATSVTFSPDGKELAFVLTSPFALRIVPRGGGVPRTIVTDRISGGGVVWSSDGYLYFDGAREVSRIRPDGSGRETVAALDTAAREIGLAWPNLLPGGRGVLFRTRRIGEDTPNYRVSVVDLRTKERKALVNAVAAQYVSSGHLVYVTWDGVLMAQRFDLDRLAVVGSPVEVARNLTTGIFGAADVAISSHGDLLYTTGVGSTKAEPTWFTPSGVATPVDSQWSELSIGAVAISPDGSRLAVHIAGANSTVRTEDVWVKSLPTGPLSRLTTEGEQNRRPQWTPDGRELIFVSTREGPPAIYRQRADGSAPAVRMVTARIVLDHGLVTRDGHWLVMQTQPGSPGDGNILGMRIGIDTMPVPLLASPTFREEDPAVSPDGRWIAYASNETGRSEVYVRPFPNVNDGKIQVSTEGGALPRFNATGDGVFYRRANDDMMLARVAASPSFRVLEQSRLFSARGMLRPYDVARDGRLLLLRPRSTETGETATSSLALVQGFASELRRILP